MTSDRNASVLAWPNGDSVTRICFYRDPPGSFHFRSFLVCLAPARTDASAHTETLPILSLSAGLWPKRYPKGKREEVGYGPSPFRFAPCSTLIPYLSHLPTPILFQETNNEQGLPSLAVLPTRRAEEIQLYTLATLPGSSLVLFSFSEHAVQAKACPGLWAIVVTLLMSARAWNSLIKALSL